MKGPSRSRRTCAAYVNLGKLIVRQGGREVHWPTSGKRLRSSLTRGLQLTTACQAISRVSSASRCAASLVLQSPKMRLERSAFLK